MSVKKEKVSDLVPDIERIFTEFLLEYDFVSLKIEQDDFSIRKSYQCDNRYIIVQLSFHPRDGHPHLNLILGEGGLNWPDTDWNSVALWRLKNQVLGTTEGSEYLITFENCESHLEKARKDLLAYQAGFLTNNLETFYIARKLMNAQRQPYQILTPDKEGKYSARDDEASKKLKEKYS